MRLNRRTMLLGAGGVAIGLPLLDAMLERRGSRARAQTAPSRYCVVFAGQACGGDGWANDRSMVAGVRNSETGHWIVPSTYGDGYEITTPLRPLETMRDQLQIVSNMRIPYSTTSTDAAAVPPGGAYRDFHGGGKSPLLSGTRSTEARFTCNGPTSDQLIAQLHAGATTHESLVLRAQPSWYLSGSSYAGRQYVSYRGMRDPIEAQTSPQIAFDSLFRGFVPDDDAAAARQDFERRARRSVLDVVLGKRDQLLARLGRADRERIERHFDELRDLETRIAALPPVAGGGCEVPTDPGPDSPIGGDNTGSGSDDIRPGAGYSNEHERARIMADLIHMAFVCDLTRVATLQITTFQSHMSVLPVSEMLGTPIYADLHEVGHNGDANTRGQFAVSLMMQWHVSHYAYLIDKMRGTSEGDGSLLDHSVVVFTPEAGHGRQLNDATTDFQTHSVERMVMLVAGRGDGSLRTGQHVDAAGAHPAHCLVTAMQAAGYESDTLGEVSGTISAMTS
ncbi:DUF1552 domain-containing protein [Sandaracinus amylolyticus]|nr:DUF1552 domain-containing protein [Sandaracinus amylolyticus]